MNSNYSGKKTYYFKWIASFFGVLAPLYSSIAQVSETEEASFWLWQFFGRLHPMIVHFPISLLIFAGILELFTLKKFNHPLRPGIRILALAGAISAVFSAIFGLLLASNEGVTGQILDIHQWIGIVSAGLSLVLLFFLRKRKPKTKAIPIYRTLLFISGIGVGLAGHFGASLTHGEDFLTEVLPWGEDSEAPESITIDLATFTSDLSPDQEIKLVTNVRSVLAHNC
ncbi:MAG TPA: DUF2231 domain-containing protein, partial [Algoriphagus sp.]|nr:DUF2231 domain-containing protein [Algoriphagus sp.]